MKYRIKEKHKIYRFEIKVNKRTRELLEKAAKDQNTTVEKIIQQIYTDAYWEAWDKYYGF